MRTKWTMLTLCFVGVLINYIDRTNFSLGAPLMARELGFSPATMGLLLGAFYWLYTLALLPVGALMDRFGVRTIYPAAMIFWSLASAATALGQGVASIFTARLLMGGGESASWPANAKVVSRWFPRPQRGTATSLWHAGIGIGSAVSYPFVAYLIATFGWRASFVITGFMGVVFGLIWIIAYRDPRVAEDAAPSPAAAQPAASRRHAPWWTLLRQKTVLGLAIGFFFVNVINSFFLLWFPLYLSDARGFSLKQIATVGALPSVSAIVGGLLGGVVADALYRRGWSLTAARKTCLVGGLIASSLIGPAAMTADIPLAIGLFCIAYAGIAFTSSNLQALPPEVAESADRVGTVAAIQTVGGTLAGIISSWLIGVVVEINHGSYVAPTLAVAACALLGALNYLFVVGRIGPDAATTAAVTPATFAPGMAEPR
ncbi:MFS transporter [Bradyrhizobium sp. U87765 SZCCT0131]|uniref:MFS transporter n=1 Tax=unclassified Bradyrhizobium TaxID=2631580 RepID=UPI001BA8407D|nr:MULTISPECIES: MFS transporter [unclassified Bradyrhizobium]MBR1219019.1 MFS transporter [Bradyrhizobium sp. U87765 SZCCT0131]MBR1261670.1 MFS transporter [Bradyrhizobium sp. U87765 SZCCT0134]MBR1306477.1 MFS transporter [Bradyrhizobium sp. U87765 SZCCT0110]MBR1317452.1 MFS transporter [Bradyrhizobium sp. U87765 SZCCT0109]MBR1351154.1 MFS transporter [Bradyrhizobium sp. U87765 SZCCT0048]